MHAQEPVGALALQVVPGCGGLFERLATADDAASACFVG
jgi:hypothetical protein